MEEITEDYVKRLFPLKAQVTKEMLTNVDIWDANDCIGARALKSVLPKGVLEDYSLDIEYYSSFGRISKFFFYDRIWNVKIQTFDKEGGELLVMDIKEPTEIIFKLQEP